VSIDLTYLKIRDVDPVPLDFGSTITGALGAPTQHIDRLGNRWTMAVVTPPMKYEPDGRLTSIDMDMALLEGGVFSVRVPGFKPGTPGSPVLASDVTSGRSIALSGLTPNYAIKKGAPISIVHGGRRYFDRVRAQVIAASDGTATISIRNLIRVPLTSGDVVEIGAPKIEGSISEYRAPIPVNGLISFSFRITEDE
tara:strand:- start:440 stop:1027 length:588 start_codon:yes stop_codon:yes gene_type:complete